MNRRTVVLALDRRRRRCPLPLVEVVLRPVVAHAVDRAEEAGADDITVLTDTPDVRRLLDGEDRARTPVRVEVVADRSAALARVTSLSRERARGTELLVLDGTRLHPYSGSDLLVAARRVSFVDRKAGRPGARSLGALYLPPDEVLRRGDLPWTLSREMLTRVPGGLPAMPPDTRVRCLKIHRAWLDGLLPHLDAPVIESEPGIWRGATAPHIASDADLEGPVLLGNDVVVGRGSSVGPGAVLGHGVVLEGNNVVRHAVLPANTVLASGERIEGPPPRELPVEGGWLAELRARPHASSGARYPRLRRTNRRRRA